MILVLDQLRFEWGSELATFYANIDKLIKVQRKSLSRSLVLITSRHHILRIN